MGFPSISFTAIFNTPVAISPLSEYRYTSVFCSRIHALKSPKDENISHHRCPAQGDKTSSGLFRSLAGVGPSWSARSEGGAVWAIRDLAHSYTEGILESISFSREAIDMGSWLIFTVPDRAALVDDKRRLFLCIIYCHRGDLDRSISLLHFPSLFRDFSPLFP